MVVGAVGASVIDADVVVRCRDDENTNPDEDGELVVVNAKGCVGRKRRREKKATAVFRQFDELGLKFE